MIQQVFLNLFDRFSQKRILSYPCGATASQYFWRPLREKRGVGESGSNLIIQCLVCMSVLYFLFSDAGSDWGQEEMGTTEDEMAGWHHGLDGHEFE